MTPSRLEADYAGIDQQFYRGQIGSPKSPNSRRWAALGDGLMSWVSRWLELLPDTRPDAWPFPSERVKSPLPRQLRLPPQSSG